MCPDNIEAQLFHTYTTVSRRDPELIHHAERLTQGYLRMFPHPEVEIGLEPAWSEDPIKEHNWRFQYQSLVWLDRVRRAFIETGDYRYRTTYVRLLRSWIASNPVECAQSDYSWFDMSVGLRAIVLVHAVVELGEEPWLVESMNLHGEMLADPKEYDARGNHGLHQDMGLVALGHYLGRQDWLELAQERISVMFRSSVDEQGVCREGSIDYQYRNFRWYEEVKRRLSGAGLALPDEIAERLPLMTEFLAHAMNPGAEYLLIGDTLKHVAPRTPGTATMWPVEHEAAPVELTKVYKAGYLFTRSAWTTWDKDPGTSLVATRFGPGRSDAVHGHEDAGSILLDAFGESLLRDSGLYAYQAGEERLYFRGRASHNVIDVPSRKFYPSADSELVAFSEQEGALGWTIRSSALQGVVWHRSVAVLSALNTIVVDDRVVLHGEDRVVQRWHLPPGSSVHRDGSGKNVRVSTAAGNWVDFHQFDRSLDLQVDVGAKVPLAGWFSTAYNEMSPAPAIAFGAEGKSVRFSTIVTYGSGKTDAGPVEVGELSRSAKVLRARLSAHGQAVRIAMSAEELSISKVD